MDEFPVPPPGGGGEGFDEKRQLRVRIGIGPRTDRPQPVEPRGQRRQPQRIGNRRQIGPRLPGGFGHQPVDRGPAVALLEIVTGVLQLRVGSGNHPGGQFGNVGIALREHPFQRTQPGELHPHCRFMTRHRLRVAGQLELVLQLAVHEHA